MAAASISLNPAISFFHLATSLVWSAQAREERAQVQRSLTAAAAASCSRHQKIPNHNQKTCMPPGKVVGRFWSATVADSSWRGTGSAEGLKTEDLTIKTEN